MAQGKKILTQDEILQILNENDSELSGFSDDDGDDQTFEARMLEGQSSSDDEENDQSIILNRPFTSRFPDPSPQSSIPTEASTKVKRNKKEKKTYKWVVKKYTPVPHPGPLDCTQLPVPNPVRTPLQYFSQYFPSQFFNDAAHFTNQNSMIKSNKSMKTDSQELKSFFCCQSDHGLCNFFQATDVLGIIVSVSASS
ncbi:hypothetical protein JTE90_026577 [Oedothorax gibbosus]|uniref:PiggyBac transposable element-derived protein domain-containing protein n=1 Tax=Oedothorax gibbosus TaxID=931172 RepID=A0AAV6U098_9ARAC|nr:hypothetical protein JTE90_026577 [Oedothorax gibbosus]